MPNVRRECLRPADDGWEPPTAAEVREIIAETGLSGSGVARFLGISSKGSRVIRRWAGGEDQIPYSAWALLCDRAGYRRIWEPREE
ncbi:transcriptional regulator (plasmid) [Sphingopyxis sp. MG]|nr:transcriptional regulator [Sphingopyxis sp. MG]